MTKKIGVIGFGTMAEGMVKNLLKNNYTVVCYNRSKHKIKKVQHDQIIAVDYPQEVAEQTDIIFVCVSDDAALDKVFFEEKGVMKKVTSRHILIDCSTTSAAMTEKMYHACLEKKAAFLDAPLTGSKLGAHGGTLLFMVGGEKNIVDKIMPLFMAMGTKVIYCGKSTYGQRAKLALNLTQALIFESYVEGLLFAMKNGIDRDTMMELLDNSGAKNNLASFKMPYILKNDFEPHFKLDLMKKDLSLIHDELHKLNLHFPLSEHILSIYQKASKEGLGEKDYIATIKILEKIAGVKINDD